MDNRGRRDSAEDGKIDGIDGVDHRNGEEFEQPSSMDGSSSSSSVSGQNRETRSEVGLTERLTDIFVNEGDGDLLIQQTDREDRLLQWLQALDMQVMGACRSDERLKPLLKMNVSNGVAEDRLLAQLSRHFDPAEVGMLARCFCIPLVSVRVGKINKQGTRMCPTSNRGNLNLAILPTSDLRLSFIGDDGHAEIIFTLSRKSQCSAVAIDDIKADSSGRSFLIRIPDGATFYFWCSEKSKLLGTELLSKMKDLLQRKPSIAELSGISKSRLDCFATHLRAFLMGNSITSSASTTASSGDDAQNASDTSRNSWSSKFVRSRHIGSQVAKANPPYQGSLSPRSSSFKEGQPRNLASFRSAGREKIRRHGDNHQSSIDSSVDSMSLNDASGSCLNLEKLPEEMTNCSISDSFFLQPRKLAIPPLGSAVQVPSSYPPLLSPYYCWCPPGASSVSFSASSPPSSPSSPLLTETSSLPPLSSLLPSSSTTNLLRSCPPLNVANVTSVNFPFLPDSLVRLPLPVTQQIPTFTPLMCDPIVHIPVIDVCSSGQGYLVSAGPAMSTSIPPLHPQLVNPLIPETDSMVEEGARETLRLLISGSTQTNQQILEVLPNVLTSADEKQSLVVTGSRGLYSGTSDIDVITNSIAAMGLVSSISKVDTDAEAYTTFGFSDELPKISWTRSDDALSDDDPHGGGTSERK